MSCVLINQYSTGLFVSYSWKNPIVRKLIPMAYQDFVISYLLDRNRGGWNPKWIGVLIRKLGKGMD